MKWFAGMMLLMMAGVLFLMLEARQPNGHAQTWRYRIEGVPDETLVLDLNTAGRDGWEMVQCRRAMNLGTAEYECLLKKPRWTVLP